MSVVCRIVSYVSRRHVRDSSTEGHAVMLAGHLMVLADDLRNLPTNCWVVLEYDKIQDIAHEGVPQVEVYMRYLLHSLNGLSG